MIRSLCSLSTSSSIFSSTLSSSSSSSTISSILSYSTIAVTKHAGLRSITLNRPDKFNEVLAQLGEAAKDEETTVTTITGAGFKDRYLAAEEMKVVSGKYFSSGNDMTSFSEVP